MDEFEEKLKQDFASWGKVLNISKFTEELNTQLKANGFKKNNSRLIFSVCSDDCNRLAERETAEKALTRLYDREFHLGGLAGYPFGGITGITAASHHPPKIIADNGQEESDGNLVFFISPHVGMIKKQIFIYGSLIRPGQQKPTASCGALMAFYNELKKAGSPEKLNIEIDEFHIDPTRLILQKELINKYSDRLEEIISINEINQQIIELFKLNYDLIVNKLHQMIKEFLRKEKNNFNGKIAIVSGITVNAPNRDYFILKNIQK